MGREKFCRCLANYHLNIFPLGQNRHFESSFSTTSGGGGGGGGGGRSGEIGIKDSQTGSASVTYVYKKRKTRSKEAEKTVADQKTKYSDVSVYCHTLGLYCICGEVKMTLQLARMWSNFWDCGDQTRNLCWGGHSTPNR